jgi:hypothetical protein
MCEFVYTKMWEFVYTNSYKLFCICKIRFLWFHMYEFVLQIRIYEFVLIYNLQTRQKKLLRAKKKGFPLEPRYAGMCTFSTKNVETHAVWFETWACTISCLYQNHQDTIQDSRLIWIHFHAIANPFGGPKVGPGIIWALALPIRSWKEFLLVPGLRTICRKWIL